MNKATKAFYDSKPIYNQRDVNRMLAYERAKVLAEVEEFINQEQEVLINRGSDGKDKWTPTKMKLSTVGVAELRAKLAEMKGGK